MSKPKQKKSATVRNPSIEAVVKELLRLPNEQSALDKMENIREHFVVSKQQIEDGKNPSLMLWIKGFDVSSEELKKGYLGHFAVIAPKMLEDKKFTLTATKVEFELAKHPQRKYQAKKQRHPNWGHPVLRKIKKGVKNVSLEEAASMLIKLHEEYPDASIPGDLKLYLMIYQKPNKGEKPIKKYVFEIEQDLEHEGQCDIIYYENTYGQTDKPATPPVDQEILGRFTARAMMKKKRK